VDYVVLDIASIEKTVTVAEAELKSYYEQNLARLAGMEERRASHILITADKSQPAAEREKAKAKAQELLALVQQSPDKFAEIARKNSQDPGSAAKGGDLDFFGRDAMTKPFSDATFALSKGEISGVVETEFGYHIIRLTGIKGGSVKPFESVKAELALEIGKQQAQGRYAEAAEQFSNMVYEQSDSLQPVVDKLKLERHTATVHRTPAQGVTGPLASAKLLEAVFGGDTLKNKRNTEAIDIGNNQLVAARVVAHRPERVLPLTEVRAQVVEQVRQEQARALAHKEGQQRLTALKSKPDEALPQSGVLSRTQAQNVPRALLDAVLRADLARAPAVLGVDLGAQGYAVARVLKVVPRATGDANVEQARSFVTEALADAEAQAYYATLKRRFKAQAHELKPVASAQDEKK